MHVDPIYNGKLLQLSCRRVTWAPGSMSQTAELEASVDPEDPDPKAQQVGNNAPDQGYSFERKRELWWKILLVIVCFYAVPTGQFVFSEYDNAHDQNQIEQRCRFNFKCATTAWKIHNLNAVLSNLVYLSLGIAYFTLVRFNVSGGKPLAWMTSITGYGAVPESEEETGVKRGTHRCIGLHSAVGVALAGEG